MTSNLTHRKLIYLPIRGKKNKKQKHENQISLLGDLILRSIIVILMIYLTSGLKYLRSLLLFIKHMVFGTGVESSK